MFKTKLLTLMFLGAMAGASEASICSTTVGNAPGDIIETWIQFLHSGSGLTYITYIDNQPYGNYGGVVDVYNSKTCWDECARKRFTARNWNIYISVEVYSGSGSGWQCNVVSQIVGHDTAFDAQRVPIPQWKKDVAKANADFFASGRTFFDSILLACPYAPIPGIVCKTSSGMVVFLSRAEAAQRKIYNDPWDGAYCETYNGNWPALDSDVWPTESGYLNNLANNIQRLDFFSDFIYVSANRASSADQAGSNCGDWQRYRVTWGLEQFGYELNEAGNNLWGVAWELEYWYGADPEVVQLIRDVASGSQWAAGEFVQ